MAAESDPIDAADTEDRQDGVEIELTDLRKEFGDLTAVNDVSLTVDPGELVLLLGPSGCGKTTTLRMLAGLEVATSGEITIDGEDVTRTHPGDRDLSMVFQSYALYPHKSVYGNLEFPLNKTDLDDEAKDRRIQETAELLEIDDLLDDKPTSLSGGQRQRVALGRTLVREPKVFLMDEPLSNLDEKLRIHARTEIRSLQQRFGTTTVYVTHDQEEAMSLADRIVIMNDGRIEQVDTPQRVYREPVNEFVAGFIGEPAMNFLEAEPGTNVVKLDAGFDLNCSLPASTVRIGIRPEDLYLDPDAAPSEASLTDPVSFTVDVIEPQGFADELTLYLDETEVTTWVRSRPTDIREGDDVEVYFDATNIHAFDEQGVRL